jgi:hypothetical protein
MTTKLCADGRLKSFPTRFVNAVADHLEARGVQIADAYDSIERHARHVDAAVAQARRHKDPDAMVASVGDFILSRLEASR